MTREDIEQLNVAEPYCFETDREEQWYSVGLKHGLDIADESPRSPWISVEDDMPCNHEELVESICQLNDLPLRETKKVFIHYKNGSYGICYMIETNSKWKWYRPKSDIDYWTPIPELSKE